MTILTFLKTCMKNTQGTRKMIQQIFCGFCYAPKNIAHFNNFSCQFSYYAKSEFIVPRNVLWNITQF